MFDFFYNYWYADQIKAEADRAERRRKIETDLSPISDPNKKATSDGASFFVKLF